MIITTQKDRITLSRCDGGINQTTLTPYTCTFKQMCQDFSQPKVGTKEGSYFIRGKATKRGDAYLQCADVAILDADSSIDLETGEVTEGAPPPKDVHQALEVMDVRHLIYTSYSHSIKGNRYRVVVPAKLSNKLELAAVVEYLVSELQQRGVNLHNVKENYTWSQPWYHPRVPGVSQNV
ncbi:MAG: hypothetical protein GY820_20235 [Gammaproteobacteria bacterium]|nr:hypothetical protein [Gammaproteobacteria bacterium]